VNLRQLFSDNLLFFVSIVNIYRDSKKLSLRLRLVNCVYPFVRDAGYALQFIIMKIVCEVDCLEDNEPIIYGSYARWDCLYRNEFVGNEDEERASEWVSEHKRTANDSFLSGCCWMLLAGGTGVSMYKREWNSRVRSWERPECLERLRRHELPLCISAKEWKLPFHFF